MKSRFAVIFIALAAAVLFCGYSAVGNHIITAAYADNGEAEAGSSGMEAAAQLIVDIPTTQYFTDDPVAAEDIDKILLAGVNAPSAMNGQPWHFSAISDPDVVSDISKGMSFSGPPAGMTGFPAGEGAPDNIGEMPEGFALHDGENMPAPPAGGRTSKAGIEDAPLVIVISCKAGSEFDAGLACQNMSAQAQLLGYGTKIVSSPTMAINAQGQEELRAALGIPEGYSACALLLVGVEDTTVDTTADTYTGATSRNPLNDVVTYLEP